MLGCTILNVLSSYNQMMRHTTTRHGLQNDHGVESTPLYKVLTKTQHDNLHRSYCRGFTSHFTRLCRLGQSDNSTLHVNILDTIVVLILFSDLA